MNLSGQQGVYVDVEKGGDEGCCVRRLVSFREVASPVSVFAQCCSNPALAVAKCREVNSTKYSKLKHSTMFGLIQPYLYSAKKKVRIFVNICK